MTAPTWQSIPDEQRLLVSPAWFVLVDDWRRGPYSTTALSALLDRWDQRAWVPTGIPPVRTPSGVVAYPGLGRRREPLNAEPELYRVRLAVPGYAVLYVPDDQLASYSSTVVGREFVAQPYNEQYPPQTRVEPEVVRLLPGIAFGYPPATRIVSGVVRWAGSGTPIGNAYVSAEGRTEPDGVPWRERTLSSDTGAFRLSLRWAGTAVDASAGTESFTLTAIEGPGRTGQLTVRLPDDLGRINVIEITQ